MDEKLKKVAIVGGGPSRRKAPFDDETWEIWAFSSRAWKYPRVTRWFELHSMIDLRDQLSTYRPGRRSYRGYMRMLRQMTCPVYMQKEHPAIPNSVTYPLDLALERFGRCFTSTSRTPSPWRSSKSLRSSGCGGSMSGARSTCTSARP